jgi:hypothetical protein
MFSLYIQFHRNKTKLCQVKTFLFIFIRKENHKSYLILYLLRLVIHIYIIYMLRYMNVVGEC